MVLGQAGDLGVADVLDGVRAVGTGQQLDSQLIKAKQLGYSPSGVLGEGRVVVVDLARVLVEHDVLENRTEADGAKDIRLLLGRETDALGVAAALDVEHAALAPAVLVVADQRAVGVGRERRLARAGEAEEERDVAVLALVGRRVQRQHVVDDGHLVEQDGEDALLHLARVLGAQDDHLLVGKVNGDRGARGHAFGEAVGRERARIVDRIVGVEVLELLAGRADEHVPHEQGMVRAGADNADADPVLLVPAGIAVDDVDSRSRVQVVDSTLAVDFPDLSKHTMLVWSVFSQTVYVLSCDTK